MVMSRAQVFFSAPRQVESRRGTSRIGRARLTLLGAAIVAAGCRTADPVTVYPSFTTSPAFASVSPANVAVLPVENGSGDPTVDRHLLFMRQELMNGMITRLYAAPRQTWVDAALRDLSRSPESASSVLDPGWLKKAAATVPEEAVMAVRVDRWDESQLLINRRVFFQFQAALVDKEGQQLWYGTMSGDIKAGGAGAAPRDKEYMARSCIELAIRELLLRLPAHARQ